MLTEGLYFMENNFQAFYDFFNPLASEFPFKF